MGRYISQSRGCRGGPVRPSRGQGLKSPEARASVSPEARASSHQRPGPQVTRGQGLSLTRGQGLKSPEARASVSPEARASVSPEARASSHQRPGPQVTRGQGLKSADPAPARQLPSSRSARGPAVVAPSRGAARGRDSPWVLLAGREAGGCRQPGPSPASAFLIHFLFKRLCRLEIWRDLNELGPISPGHGLAGRRLVSGRPRGWEGLLRGQERVLRPGIKAGKLDWARSCASQGIRPQDVVPPGRDGTVSGLLAASGPCVGMVSGADASTGLLRPRGGSSVLLPGWRLRIGGVRDSRLAGNGNRP